MMSDEINSDEEVMSIHNSNSDEEENSEFLVRVSRPEQIELFQGNYDTGPGDVDFSDEEEVEEINSVKEETNSVKEGSQQHDHS